MNHIIAAVLLGLLVGVPACSGARASGSSSGTTAKAMSPKTAARGGIASPWLDDPVSYMYKGTAYSGPVTEKPVDDAPSGDDDFGDMDMDSDDGGGESSDDLGGGAEEIEIDPGDDGWGDDEDWDDEEDPGAE